MRTFLASALVCLLAAVPAVAQPSPPADDPVVEPSAVATYVDEAPKIDGVLDDPIWQQIQPISDFKQRDPAEGQEPTERTELRIAFDEEAIYFGITLFDQHPRQCRGL